jgi:hypothetical protein
MVRYPKMLTALTDLLDIKTHPAAVVVQAWRVLQNFVSGMDEIKVPPLCRLYAASLLALCWLFAGSLLPL